MYFKPPLFLLLQLLFLIPYLSFSAISALNHFKCLIPIPATAASCLDRAGWLLAQQQTAAVCLIPIPAAVASCLEIAGWLLAQQQTGAVCLIPIPATAAFCLEIAGWFLAQQ